MGKTGLLAGLTVLLVLASAAAGSAARPLETGVYEPAFAGVGAGLALDRARSAGASTVRISAHWNELVSGTQPPADATDPADEAYRWVALDEQLTAVRERGLEPILTLYAMPSWATVAPVAGAARTLPHPGELGKFALAAARRYSGRFEGLPRVRYWQVWNEPNLTPFLRPQLLRGRPFSPGWYRRMVNEVARAVKSVRADNLVVAGGTAPFRDITPEVQKVNPRWGPLTFMRELLCLTKSLRKRCNQRIRFDIWSHHPYTSGGPTHHAVLPDDVSLGDLPEMRRVLERGIRVGNVVSPRGMRFWVTEFSWDSNGPDPYGVPMRLHTRWVAEALYRMWSSGVSQVTWFLLRDNPLAASPFQSGLYYRGATLAADRPKPSLAAFRFPFVAFAEKRGIYVWGRTPRGRPTRVLVEQQFRGGWKRVGIVRANAQGILQARFATHRTGFVRARTLDVGERAVPFSLRPVPDRYFNPFGGQPLEPRRP